MMNKRVKLKDEEMNIVNGGNYGDAARDTGKNPMYKAGQEVEVFNTCFHNSTTRKKILSVHKLNGHWQYQVESDVLDQLGELATTLRNSATTWITANSVEA